MENRKTANKMK